jgi:hypothetical protein
MENQKSKTGFRWNWGVGIALVYVVFVVGMLTMVFMSKNQKIDLVTENYYQQELLFQDEINAKQRVANGNCLPVMAITPGGCNLEIPGAKGAEIAGDLLAYCPSNKNGDCMISLPKTTKGGWEVDLSKLKSNNYLFKIHWTKGGEIYSATLPFKK